MLAEVKRNQNPSAKEISVWETRKYEVESDCVGEMRALQEDCYNRTMASLGRVGNPIEITRWQRLWMQLYSFENSFQKN